MLAVGDLYEPLKSQITAAPFNVIVANPPYVPSANIATLDRNVREYEPRLALDGGDDGLSVVRRIFAEAPQRLVPGGRVYVEIQFDQGPAALQIARSAGLADSRIIKDNSGHDRIVLGI